MIDDRKKTIALIITITAVIGIILVIVININKDKIKDQISTVIEDNEAENDVVVDKVTFSKITKVYNDGITTLSAEMLNNTNETKNFTIEIILKNDDFEEVKKMIQIVEDLEPGKVKVLTTGIAGDYSYIRNVEFKMVEG